MISVPAADAVHLLGAAVRRARKLKGLTQAEPAQRAHVSRVFVIDLESGHPRAELGKVFAVLDGLDLRPFPGETHDDMPTSTTQLRTPPAATPYSPSFVVAESLDTLRGPDRGEVTLPNRLMWNNSRSFDLSSEKRRRSLIRIVLREARNQRDLEDFVDRKSLIDLWPSLGLPEAIALAWERKFPELSAMGAGRR